MNEDTGYGADAYFQLADPVMAGLKHAKEEGGLTYEFMAAFLNHLGVNRVQVEEAISYAFREWDL